MRVIARGDADLREQAFPEIAVAGQPTASA
jgi:hypothetical protein